MCSAYKQRYYYRQLSPCLGILEYVPATNPTFQLIVLTTVLNIDQRTNECSSVCFDLNSLSVVCDNSANVHICNRHEDL